MKKKVPKGWIKVAEFAKLIGASQQVISTAIKRGSIPEACADRVGTGATSPYYIDPQPAAKNWYNCLNAANPLTRQLHEGLEKYIKTFDRAAIAKEKKKKATESEGMSLSEAQRRREIAKALEAELDLKKKEGSLVEKAKVYDQLFAAGQQLRNALLSIPDRVIDEVVAVSNSRTKALNVIYDAIAKELERLTDVGVNE